MYIQAAIEKRSSYIAEIVDPVVDDLDYPDFETMLTKYPLDLVGISAYTHSLPDVQMTINLVRKINPKSDHFGWSSLCYVSGICHSITGC